jgi:hypothetical protein
MNLERAKAKLSELQAMKAAKSPAPAPATTKPTEAAPEVLTATFTEFRAMDSATRANFAADGGSLAKSDFDRLSARTKSAFCIAGGKIIDDTPTKANSFGGSRSFGTANL